MPSSYSRHIGTHMYIIVSASGVGVITAAKIAIANQAYLRFDLNESMFISPMRSMNNMINGVSNDRPNTTGSMMARLIHSLRRMSGVMPRNSLNQSSAFTALGITRN